MIDLDGWRPRPSWLPTVTDAQDALGRNPGDPHAWSQVAMMMGDTGAPEMGLLVALHGRSAARGDARLGSHIALFVIDLGLGVADDTGTVRLTPSALDQWVDGALASLGLPDLETAAWWGLRLAIERTTVA